MTQTARQEQAGFIRVELLVVFVILGILATIVAIAAGGMKDEGRAVVCTSGFSSIANAEEAYYASQTTGRYSDMSGLVGAGFLKQASTLYDVAADNTVDPKRYTISPIGITCPAIP